MREPGAEGAKSDLEARAARQNLRWEIKARAPFIGSEASWAELKASSPKRPNTPQTVRRLCAPPQPRSPRAAKPASQPSMPPAREEPSLPFPVNTLTSRLSTTAFLYHDGIPGNAMTYFSGPWAASASAE